MKKKAAKRFDLGLHAGFLLTMAGGKAEIVENAFVGVSDGAKV